MRRRQRRRVRHGRADHPVPAARSLGAPRDAAPSGARVFGRNGLAVRAAIGIAVAGLAGCYHQETTFAGTDAIPEITSAFARCYIDASGPLWSFGATVADEDGIGDVIAVEA